MTFLYQWIKKSYKKKGFLRLSAIEYNTYRELTKNIEVEVVPIYVSDQKQFPNQYLYTYNVSITNHSLLSCQLISRHWIIIDGFGCREDIRGQGVVGDQPVIRPGQTYQYSSYCPLPTPTGNMRGFFNFVDSNKQDFQVKVPLFFLRQDVIIQ